MSGRENQRPVEVDPQCIQEALRKYLQPIKNEDPHLDFFTMYKRETTEYDTEYMRKYNEDLNTTLIFAGLFSAISSAFIIDVQSKLESDSSERSEAYLRAILLSLNPSVAPDESPAPPPAWNGPPTEVITTSDLLYASLLMSLLAAFVAMLGKQWLNRFLRHEGGSMVERCGDRQRKFDGLEKWPFHLFIESLPVMLQIALLLLTCGLSRYMWSVNTSVAWVVISFTILSTLFYFGIVVAGTSSYECPFQTPVSTALRDLKDSGTIRKLLASISPCNAISLICTIWGNARQRLTPASHHIYNAVRHPFSRGISLSCALSCIRRVVKKAGRQVIALLLRIDQIFRNAKRRLARGIKNFRRSGVLLPATLTDEYIQPLVPQAKPGLRVRVRNLGTLQKQNEDNARCVCWVLRNITDPEAIDSAIRLAGTIRWFNGDSDHDPPFDVIVSTFDSCFDSSKQLYPGMRDRAYFSARAILQINTGATAQSQERAYRYPIPEVSSGSSAHIDPDLQHIIFTLERNFGSERPVFPFPKEGTHAHLLWMSNLLVDMTRAGPNPRLESHWHHLNIAATNQPVVVANVLLMWHMLLGGHVEEETFWAADKSDTLETILSHLSVQVVKIIDEPLANQLMRLLEFLAAWEKRPVFLTPMAYQWCSAISQAIERLEPNDIPSVRDAVHLYRYQYVNHNNPHIRSGALPESLFSHIGADCDHLRSSDTSHPTDEPPQDLDFVDYAQILPVALEIGFRLAAPSRDWSALGLDHTPHHEWMFEVLFSSEDDEIIADAVGVWLVDRDHKLPGLCARYLAKRMERDTPFSPRLRRMAIDAVQRNWHGELTASELETLRLLDLLNVGVDDVNDGKEWVRLLIGAVRSPTGLERLSPSYWDLLYKLVLVTDIVGGFVQRDVEVMRLLDEAGDWEKLEVWMVSLWWPPYNWFDGAMQDIEQVTLKLLSRRSSLLPMFEDRAAGKLTKTHKIKLREICDKVRAEHLPSESSSLRLSPVRPPVPLSFAGDDSF